MGASRRSRSNCSWGTPRTKVSRSVRSTASVVGIVKHVTILRLPGPAMAGPGAGHPPGCPMHDLVVRNGAVVDGTGAATFVGDVAVDGGVITEARPRASGAVAGARATEM